MFREQAVTETDSIRLARLEEKFDAFSERMIELMDVKNDALNERCETKESRIACVETEQREMKGRIEALEKNGAYNQGKTVVISAIISMLGTLLCGGLVLLIRSFLGG